MKLRNKKTGEIKELQEIMHEAFIEHNEKSLMNLEKDWEDYEEPKGYWYIRDGGNIDFSPKEFSIAERHKKIGNYFETKEEAERAVEKLKAWKRLKDNGFEFLGLEKKVAISISIKAEVTKQINNAFQAIKDLNLLFGDGE